MTVPRGPLPRLHEPLVVVAEAADGLEALTVWRDLDGPPVPDAIILDNRMPGLTGIEVAERILGERPGQIVILYSAFMDKKLRADAERLGVAAWVSKGDHDALPDLVRQLASRAGADHPDG